MDTTNVFGVSKIDDRDYTEILNRNNMLSLLMKENHSTITELEKAVVLLKEREHSLKEQEVKCSHELCQLEEQQKSAQEEVESLKERFKSLKMEDLKLKDEIKIAERRKQPSSKDRQILERRKKKLKHCKNMIGLKWDYTAPQDHCVGYVFNPTANGLKHFSFDEISSTEKIWSEVKSIAKPDWESIQ